MSLRAEKIAPGKSIVLKLPSLSRNPCVVPRLSTYPPTICPCGLSLSLTSAAEEPVDAAPGTSIETNWSGSLVCADAKEMANIITTASAIGVRMRDFTETLPRGAVPRLRLRTGLHSFKPEFPLRTRPTFLRKFIFIVSSPSFIRYGCFQERPGKVLLGQREWTPASLPSSKAGAFQPPSLKNAEPPGKRGKSREIIYFCCSGGGALQPSSRASRMRARDQSRFTDRGAISRTSAVCSTESPPK